MAVLTLVLSLQYAASQAIQGPGKGLYHQQGCCRPSLIAIVSARAGLQPRIYEYLPVSNIKAQCSG